jgi:O-antigen biosynthesis protein
MDAANASRLRQLIQAEPDPTIMGFVMEVHCPSPGEDGRENLTVVHHVKMFRNLPELRFERRIHEQIIAPIRKIGGEIMQTDIAIMHSGADHTPAGKVRKLERDLRILEQERMERPDSFTYFNLGMTYVDAEKYAEAVDSLEKSIAMSRPTETQLRKSYSLLVFALGKLNRTQDASMACDNGLQLFPQDAELRFRKGNLLHDEGKLAEAALVYKEILHGKEDWHFTSSMPGIQGILSRQNLAVVYTEMGRLPEAEEQLRLMLLEESDNLTNWHSLADNLLRQEKHREAEKILIQILERWPNDPSTLHNLGTLHYQRANLAAAIVSLRESIRHRPNSLPTVRQLAYALQDDGRQAEALEMWRRLFELSPDDLEARAVLGRS